MASDLHVDFAPAKGSQALEDGRSLFGSSALRRAYVSGQSSVADMVEHLLSRLEAQSDNPVWISRQTAAALRARAAELDALVRSQPTALSELPLFGIPFGIKDNIDLAGLPTTAACPAFTYQPEAHAACVARLIAAGAVPVGKTNLDQFATGLVGVRSPYGVPRNAFDRRFVPGGSSSGSAVAVAMGTASFALGTDTAGSGRVPAAFNGIVGLKPTRGLVSTRGVVPACRSLDCVSVFAHSVTDALTVFDVLDALDPADPFARRDRVQLDGLGGRFRFGIPAGDDLVTAGDPHNARLFAAAVTRLRARGGVPVEIPFADFFEAGALLYSGPWLAERAAAVGAFTSANRNAVHPITRAVIEGGADYSAVDFFRSSYRLAELAHRTAAMWQDIDLIMVPSAPTIYTLDQIEADPIKLNATLGTYTNFVNLLDMSALALPAGLRPDGLPFGITLIGPALADRRLAAIGLRFEKEDGDLAEAAGSILPREPTATDRRIVFAVFGAHLSGMPLNRELRDLGGRLIGPVRTAPAYRLFLIEGTVRRPGLLRVAGEGGDAIEAELWSLPEAEFGRFVDNIGAPLGIGTIELEDGSSVKGFLCEAFATNGALDITPYGGWRGFIAADSGKI